MATFDISFDEEDRKKVPSNKLTFYKAEKGRIDVISLISFRTLDDAVVRAALGKNPDLSDEDQAKIREKWLATQAKSKGRPLSMVERCGDFSSPKLGLYNVYYNEGDYNGKKLMFVRPPQCGSDEEDKVWNKISPEPRVQITTVILQYPLDRDGEVDMSRVERDYKILPWKFAKGTYDNLAKLENSAKKNNSRLGRQNIRIECKDTNYQNITPTLDGAASWLSLPLPLQEKILNAAAKVAASKDMIPGQVKTTDEVRAIVGMRAETSSISFPSSSSSDDGGGSSEEDSSDSHVDDMIDSL